MEPARGAPGCSEQSLSRWWKDLGEESQPQFGHPGSSSKAPRASSSAPTHIRASNFRTPLHGEGSAISSTLVHPRAQARTELGSNLHEPIAEIPAFIAGAEESLFPSASSGFCESSIHLGIGPSSVRAAFSSSGRRSEGVALSDGALYGGMVDPGASNGAFGGGEQHLRGGGGGSSRHPPYNRSHQLLHQQSPPRTAGANVGFTLDAWGLWPPSMQHPQSVGSESMCAPPQRHVSHGGRLGAGGGVHMVLGSGYAPIAHLQSADSAAVDEDEEGGGALQEILPGPTPPSSSSSRSRARGTPANNPPRIKTTTNKKQKTKQPGFAADPAFSDLPTPEEFGEVPVGSVLAPPLQPPSRPRAKAGASAPRKHRKAAAVAAAAAGDSQGAAYAAAGGEDGEEGGSVLGGPLLAPPPCQPEGEEGGAGSLYSFHPSLLLPSAADLAAALGSETLRGGSKSTPRKRAPTGSKPPRHPRKTAAAAAVPSSAGSPAPGPPPPPPPPESAETQRQSLQAQKQSLAIRMLMRHAKEHDFPPSVMASAMIAAGLDLPSLGQLLNAAPPSSSSSSASASVSSTASAALLHHQQQQMRHSQHQQQQQQQEHPPHMPASDLSTHHPAFTTPPATGPNRRLLAGGGVGPGQSTTPGFVTPLASAAALAVLPPPPALVAACGQDSEAMSGWARAAAAVAAMRNARASSTTTVTAAPVVPTEAEGRRVTGPDVQAGGGSGQPRKRQRVTPQEQEEGGHRSIASPPMADVTAGPCRVRMQAANGLTVSLLQDARSPRTHLVFKVDPEQPLQLLLARLRSQWGFALRLAGGSSSSTPSSSSPAVSTRKGPFCLAVCLESMLAHAEGGGAAEGGGSLQALAVRAMLLQGVREGTHALYVMLARSPGADTLAHAVPEPILPLAAMELLLLSVEGARVVGLPTLQGGGTDAQAESGVRAITLVFPDASTPPSAIEEEEEDGEQQQQQANSVPAFLLSALSADALVTIGRLARAAAAAAAAVADAARGQDASLRLTFAVLPQPRLLLQSSPVLEAVAQSQMSTANSPSPSLLQPRRLITNDLLAPLALDSDIPNTVTSHSASVSADASGMPSEAVGSVVFSDSAHNSCSSVLGIAPGNLKHASAAASTCAVALPASAAAALSSQPPAVPTTDDVAAVAETAAATIALEAVAAALTAYAGAAHMDVPPSLLPAIRAAAARAVASVQRAARGLANASPGSALGMAASLESSSPSGSQDAPPRVPQAATARVHKRRVTLVAVAATEAATEAAAAPPAAHMDASASASNPRSQTDAAAAVEKRRRISPVLLVAIAPVSAAAAALGSPALDSSLSNSRGLAFPSPDHGLLTAASPSGSPASSRSAPGPLPPHPLSSRDYSHASEAAFVPLDSFAHVRSSSAFPTATAASAASGMLRGGGGVSRESALDAVGRAGFSRGRAGSGASAVDASRGSSACSGSASRSQGAFAASGTGRGLAGSDSATAADDPSRRSRRLFSSKRNGAAAAAAAAAISDAAAATSARHPGGVSPLRSAPLCTSAPLRRISVDVPVLSELSAGASAGGGDSRAGDSQQPLRRRITPMPVATRTP